ncbi:hypothetical protein VTN00DRAFT_1766 [Thermoascus crustaceus]|uniref:uncharacterized protein n=1 Tax=Thermoascus crustaceus TaxID=5088 RepID=UPI0037433473
MDAPGATEAKGSAHDEGEKLKESATESGATSRGARLHRRTEDGPARSEDDDGEEDDDDEDEENEDDDDEEDDEEPRLKYAYLTKHMNSVYRNGDATSSFATGGDKMIIGTHNGNIHVLSLPLFESLRVYHAHSASVTCVSISPFSPPVRSLRPDNLSKLSLEELAPSIRSSAGSIGSFGTSRSSRQGVLPATPSNSIYIATSSIDGNVCVASLVDPKDVLLRNFGRPVQAVALSPEYKSDRTYLSGGRAGNLILTTGGRIGTSTNSTTMGGAAAAASGWLGSLGLGANTGKDTILHSGEGSISTIKWSLSGKYVTWVNEEGIKIMRTNLHLEDPELAWKRISHIDRPNRPGWEEMAGVWKARAEWVDESSLESDSDAASHHGDSTSEVSAVSEKNEKLVVGWGGTVWVINVYPDRLNAGRRIGSAEVATILRTDCIVSGISLYTPNLLLVLAYMEARDDEPEGGSKPHRSRRGIHRRPKGLEPELRLIDIESKEEISADTLSVSRYESLSSSDYHMSVLPPAKVPVQAAQRGTLGALGNGLWDATLYSARLLSSSASIRSSTSSGDRVSGRAPSSFGSRRISSSENQSKELQAVAGAGGVKIFIHSPYDCVVAVKRSLADRLAWLEARGKYEEAWNLVDEHPEAVSPAPERPGSVAGTPAKSQTSLVEFFADDSSSITTVGHTVDSAAEKEKRRIGDLWIEQLIDQERWKEAGEVCSRVLDTTPKWDHWIWVFIKNNKFDEISLHIPIDIHPALPSVVYEVILGHYVSRDRFKFKELVDRWPSDLFDANSVTVAIEDQLKSEDVIQDSEEWRVLMDSLARLFQAGGHYREALRCCILLQDAEAAMALIKDYRLVDAVSHDILRFILIRVSKEQMKSAPISELEEATAEPIQLLVSEAYTGIVRPETVVEQLQAANKPLYLYFYLRALWRGEALRSEAEKSRLRGRGRRMRETADKLAADEGKALIDPFADTAVELFADYDRPLLMEFLQSSTAYSFSAASTICEIRRFTPELIYLLSKMGQTKRALNLILSDLKDISQAISFCKSQDDPDLWEDLLNYSMDKPQYIHTLLTEAGMAIDPIKLVRRIPSGLEIQGLREGLARMIREHDIQASISQGAAKVMQSEVAVAMDTLRRGQRRGIKFDIIGVESPKLAEGEGEEGAAAAPDAKEKEKEKEEVEHDDETLNEEKTMRRRRRSPVLLQPGRCAGCHEPFYPNEKETLIGFACGHVFHLSHVHAHPEPAAPTADEPPPPSPPLPRPSTAATAIEEPSISRTVGPKVTTARLLRDRIGDGCRICALGRQVEKAVDSGS